MRQTPVNDYLKEISTELPEEIYGCLSDAIYETTCEFDEEVGLLKAENAKLREAVATAIKVQAVLCGDADSWYCRNKCPLHRPESNDCLACDVIGVAQELGIEV